MSIDYLDYEWWTMARSPGSLAETEGEEGCRSRLSLVVACWLLSFDAIPKQQSEQKRQRMTEEASERSSLSCCVRRKRAAVRPCRDGPGVVSTECAVTDNCKPGSLDLLGRCQGRSERQLCPLGLAACRRSCWDVCACVVKAWNGKCCSPSPGSLSRASVRKRQQSEKTRKWQGGTTI